MSPRALVLMGGGSLLLSLIMTLASGTVVVGDSLDRGYLLASWVGQVTLYLGVGLLVVAALVLALRTPTAEGAPPSRDYYE